MADSTARRLKALRYPLTCALVGHRYHQGGIFREAPYLRAGHRLLFLSVCNRCGDFAGWHHHDLPVDQQERRDCWICKRAGEV